MKLSKQLRITLIFVIAIFASFISDYLHTFLGDWYCSGMYWNECGMASGCLYPGMGVHYPTWHYGLRHWMLIVLGIVLFFMNISDISSED